MTEIEELFDHACRTCDRATLGAIAVAASVSRFKTIAELELMLKATLEGQILIKEEEHLIEASKKALKFIETYKESKK